MMDLYIPINSSLMNTNFGSNPLFAPIGVTGHLVKERRIASKRMHACMKKASMHHVRQRARDRETGASRRVLPHLQAAGHRVRIPFCIDWQIP